MPGTRRRGTSFKHFNCNTEQRSLETGTHTQGMTLRLDTEAEKNTGLIKGQTNELNKMINNTGLGTN